MKTTLIIIGVISAIGLVFCVYKMFKTSSEIQNILRKTDKEFKITLGGK
jgi:hypothetical protein